jgi:hypothetical protein
MHASLGDYYAGVGMAYQHDVIGKRIQSLAHCLDVRWNAASIHPGQ